jgi:vanillate O-demethylase monooxygenase subunit
MDNADTISDLDQRGEAALFRAMRRFWQPVSYARDLAGRPQKATLLGEPIVLARLGGQVCAFPDLCVHRGTALSLGRIEGDELRCAYHGWTYGADGACSSIPARFGLNIPARARLKKYRAAEACGLIWVCLDGEPVHPLPEFPELDDPAFRVVTMPAYEWRCNFARRVENYVDFAHFAWVHDGLLGDRNQPEVPDHSVWRDGAEIRTEIVMPEPTRNPKNKAAGGAQAEVSAVKRYRIFVPNSVRLREHISEQHVYVLFMAACPVGPKQTRTFTFLARNYDLNVPDQKYVDYNDLVIGQDEPIILSQRPEELPVDLSAELHIRGADRVSVEYRRWCIEIANLAGAQPA